MKFHKRDGVKYGIEDEIFVLCHFKNGHKVYIFDFLLVKKGIAFQTATSQGFIIVFTDVHNLLLLEGECKVF